MHVQSCFASKTYCFLTFSLPSASLDLKVPIVMGKKDRRAVFRCNSDCLSPEKETVKFSARVNTERVPPGHPIILLKTNKFNMAAVSVKRSIACE